MGVSYGPVQPHQQSPPNSRSALMDSAQVDMQAESLEGTTVVPSSPEPISNSPIQTNNDNFTLHCRTNSRDLSPKQQDHLKSDVTCVVDIASLMNSRSRNTIVDIETTPPTYNPSVNPLTVTPSPPAQPMQGRRECTPPRPTGLYQTLPMTPTSTPPVSESNLICPSTEITPYERVLSSWHPHVYGPSIKCPTDHSIAAIMTNRSRQDHRQENRQDNALDHARSNDEPLNLTTRPSTDYREVASKGKKSCTFTEQFFL